MTEPGSDGGTATEHRERLRYADGTYKPLSTYRILEVEGGLVGELHDVTSTVAFLTPRILYD